MTNPVQILAEAPCPDKDCGCHHYPELNAKHMVKTTCHGTGALVPGLRRGVLGSTLRMPVSTSEVSDTAGPVWDVALIPEAEVMGVLVRRFPGLTIDWEFQTKQWQVEYQGDMAFDDTPEETAAHIICVAQGVRS